MANITRFFYIQKVFEKKVCFSGKGRKDLTAEAAEDAQRYADFFVGDNFIQLGGLSVAFPLRPLREILRQKAGGKLFPLPVAYFFLMFVYTTVAAVIPAHYICLFCKQP